MSDPFGLRTGDVDVLRTRPGAKWAGPHPRLAAWVADMDFPIAPAIVDRITTRVATDVGYPNWRAIGRSHLPERFAARMADRFGWEPGVDRLRETADVMQGVEIAVHHLTEPGDGIIVHTPTYSPFLHAIGGTGRTIVAVPAIDTADGWRWDYDALDDELSRAGSAGRPAARAWILCHPHNPTGRCFGRPELERIAELAERHDLVVISDEIHAELVYAPARHVPFASLGDTTATRTVTVTSASKAFNLAGLRWAILHCGVDRLDDALRALPEHYLGAPNLLAVEATDAAWSDGGDWQQAMLEQLDANRTIVADLLARYLPDVRHHRPEATYLAWLDCRRLGLGDDPAESFRERGVELSPGPRFGLGGRGFARLNFATSPTVLEAIISSLGSGGSAPPNR